MEDISNHIYNEDLEAIRAFKGDINALADGRLPLLTAIEHRSTEMVKIIVDELKADVNAKGEGKNCAILQCAHNFSLEKAKIVLEAGAKVNTKNMGYTALYIVAAHFKIGEDLGYDIEFLELLLKHGANINLNHKANRGSDSNLVIIKVLEDEWYHVANFLIDNGADLTLTDDNGRSVMGQLAFNYLLSDSDKKTIKGLKDKAIPKRALINHVESDAIYKEYSHYHLEFKGTERSAENLKKDFWGLK